MRYIEALNSAASRRIDLLVDDWSEKRLRDEEDRPLIGFEVAVTAHAEPEMTAGLGISIATAPASKERASVTEVPVAGVLERLQISSSRGSERTNFLRRYQSRP